MPNIIRSNEFARETAEPVSETHIQQDLDETRCASIVLAALRGNHLHEFDELTTCTAPESLIQLAATEHGVPWAAVPYRLVPDDHRLRLLQATASLHRYTGDIQHLDVSVFELLVRTLDTGDLDWAEQAAELWVLMALHVSEAHTVWPQAHALLTRFPDQVRTRASLLGAIAMIASCSGVDEAAGLWDEVLTHPLLGDRAEQRLVQELNFARAHLLQLADDPRRAIGVLERVQRGFAQLGTPAAELHWTNATLDLITALTWCGRVGEALGVGEDALRRVEPGSELELWIRATAAYPAAHHGDRAALATALDAIEHASTDTASLQLRLVAPIRMLEAARARDLAALDAAIAAARSLESARRMDSDQRCSWRVHAAEALAAVGEERRATDLLDELDAVLDEVAHHLAVHRLRAAHLRARLDGDADRTRELGDHATAIGVDLAVVAGQRATQVSTDAITLRLLGRFCVARNGVEVPNEAWAGRRQARLLLAMLLIEGGTVTIDQVTETLWDSVDPIAARNRIKPLCNTIRSVLVGPGEGESAGRALHLRGGSITLELHPDDRCDLHELRSIRDCVREQPARSRELALDALRVSGERPLADLGTDAAASLLRDEVEREVLELVPQLAAAWDDRTAPAEVIEAVARAHDADPTSIDTCRQLIRLHAARGDAPAATAAFHATREALRDQLGMSIPKDVARLHATVLETTAPAGG